jgi:hypothetical protein
MILKMKQHYLIISVYNEIVEDFFATTLEEAKKIHDKFRNKVVYKTWLYEEQED